LTVKFKYKKPNLTEDHIQQICQFLKTPYVKGDYQKWNKFAQFKWWHKKKQDKRDK
jgi:hypothetical protein